MLELFSIADRSKAFIPVRILGGHLIGASVQNPSRDPLSKIRRSAAKNTPASESVHAGERRGGGGGGEGGGEGGDGNPVSSNTYRASPKNTSAFKHKSEARATERERRTSLRRARSYERTFMCADRRRSRALLPPPPPPPLPPVPASPFFPSFCSEQALALFPSHNRHPTQSFVLRDVQGLSRSFPRTPGVRDTLPPLSSFATLLRSSLSSLLRGTHHPRFANSFSSSGPHPPRSLATRLSPCRATYSFRSCDRPARVYTG